MIANIKISELLNIVLVIALFVILNTFKSTKVVNEGYSTKEVEYMLKIQALKIEKDQIINKISQNEKSIQKDSAFVYSATWRERDSIRAIINPR